MSGTGSVGGGAAGGPPPITLGVPQLTSGLRPTTAAAIANPNMDNDMMGGANDDLDDDYDNMRGGGNHDGRPNTAGPTMYRSSAQGAGGGQANTSSWGYSRDQQAPGGAKDPRAGGGAMNGGGGIADYGGGAGGADPNRRPHTAHGARAGFPSSGVYNGAPLDPKQQQQQAAMYNEVEGEVGSLIVFCWIYLMVCIGVWRSRCSGCSRHDALPPEQSLDTGRTADPSHSAAADAAHRLPESGLPPSSGSGHQSQLQPQQWVGHVSAWQASECRWVAATATTAADDAEPVT